MNGIIIRYRVYISGCSRPVYTYTTWRWLSKRLLYLAQHTGLSGVTVTWDKWDGKVSTIDAVRVDFNRGHLGPHSYGWTTKPDDLPLGTPAKGIPDSRINGQGHVAHSHNVDRNHPRSL